jgi:hypothetical protein
MAMVVKTTGIVVDGAIQLDQPLELPNHSPVNVTLEPIEMAPNKAKLAWEATKARLRERPIHGGGMRFTRDELHERR